MHSFSGLTLGHKTTTIIVPITPRNLHELEEQALADAIAAALAELKRDGSLAEIFRRHGVSHSPA